MKKKYRTLLFIAALAALLLSQYKIIMPFIYKIAASDLFLVNSNDQSSQLPISTPLSGIAFMHCNNYIKSKLEPNVSITFSEKPLNAWTLGNYQYVISAKASFTNESANTSIKNYVCRISYNNGDNEDGSLDFENWSIVGISGIDEI